MEKNKTIRQYLKEFGISSFKITEDGVDIYQNFYLPTNIKIDKLPFKINVCHGDFNIARNNINSFENFPYKVYGDFHIGWNKFESLEGGPIYVKGDYYCYDNPIKTNYTNTKIDGKFNTTLIEDGLNYINNSFVVSNYSEWQIKYRRKSLIEKIKGGI